MDELLFIVLVCIIILISIIFITIKERKKAKQMIQKQWNQDPSTYYELNEDDLIEASNSILKMMDIEETVNQATWQDLDMFDVYKKINLTYSKFGEDMLYASLKSVDVSNQPDLLVDENWQKYLTSHINDRERIQYQLNQLGKKLKTNSIYRYFLDEIETKTILSSPLIKLFAILPILSFLFMLFFPVIGIGLFIASIFFNVVFYLIYKTKLEIELSMLSYFVQTVSVSGQLSKISLVEREVKQLTKYLNPVLKYGFFFHIKSGSDVEVLVESLSAMFLLPFVSFQMVNKAFKNYQKELKELCLLLGRLDANCAVLNFRQMNETLWCYPMFHKEATIEIEQLIHPLIEEAIANSFVCQKTVLITGSNASGKSTFIKSLAISCLLSQTLNMALASSFKLKRGLVISSMGISDSISKGDSYFMSEIKSLKEMITQVKMGQFVYCFIDEILRGTNTIERIGASANTIKWLSERHCLLFVATHDVELPHILSNYCEMVYFSEIIKNDTFEFDYKLKYGINTSRNAIKLLELVSFPKEITDNATKDIKEFEKTHHWDKID
ncbi:MutS-related protein [Vagococcus sp. JNUCC 83]